MRRTLRCVVVWAGLVLAFLEGGNAATSLAASVDCGIGGTGFANELLGESGIGGTGRSPEQSGIGGTGRAGEHSGIGGTGLKDDTVGIGPNASAGSADGRGIGGSGRVARNDGRGIGGSGLKEGADGRGIGGSGRVATNDGRGIGGTGRSEPTDGRGIGGTGFVGTITAFGSICVNGSKIEYDDTTPVTVDGSSVSADRLRVGQVVVVEAGVEGDSWSARTIAVEHEVVGTVTEVDPGTRSFSVLGQRVLAAASDGSTGAPVDLPVQGSSVAISGFRRDDGTIVASAVEIAVSGVELLRSPAYAARLSPEVDSLSVEGYVREVRSATEVRVGDVVVQLPSDFRPERGSLRKGARVQLFGRRAPDGTVVVRRAAETVPRPMHHHVGPPPPPPPHGCEHGHHHGQGGDSGGQGGTGLPGAGGAAGSQDHHHPGGGHGSNRGPGENEAGRPALGGDRDPARGGRLDSGQRAAPSRPERQERPTRPDRPERPNRPERPDRPPRMQPPNMMKPPPRPMGR